MKNISHIKQLLDRYFEGETSLKEEKELKAYFNSDKVAEELKAYEGLFQFFKLEKEIVLPEQSHQIPISLYNRSSIRRTQSTKTRQLYVNIAKIAAVLLVAICAYLVLPKTSAEQSKQAINWELYEVTDEEEAVKKTIAALRLVSAKLNGGAKRAVKEVHHVQAAAKIFKK